MKKTVKMGSILACVVTMIVAGCSNFSKPLPSVAVVAGFVELVRNGNTKAVSKGQGLNKHDTLKTQRYSKVKLNIKNGELYLNSFSCLEVVKNPENKSRYDFVLHDGIMYLNYKSDSTFLTINTPEGAIKVLSSEVLIHYKKESQVLKIIPLYGTVNLRNSLNDNILITQCYSAFVHNNIVNQQELVTENEIANLKNWVGKTAITEALVLGGCEPQQKPPKKLPPKWVNFPKDHVFAGEFLEDTVVAVGEKKDEKIIYMLVDGPEGYSVESQSGIIRYKSMRSCSLKIIIRAMNSDSVSSDYEYTLNVSSTPQASLRVPSVVVKDEKFNVIASLLISEVEKPTLLFRYDLNGDGRFDYSETGISGKNSVIKDFSFSDTGEHRISVEIMNTKTNKKYYKYRKILVKLPPKVTFIITPESSKVGTESSIFVNCNGACDSLNQKIMQLDISRDGGWKLIHKETLVGSKQLLYKWDKPGKNQLRLIVTNKIDVSDTLYKEVFVDNVVLVKSILSVDTANAGDTVRFTCNMDSSSAPVNFYEWSFKENSVYATTTQNNISYVFNDKGRYLVTCKVVDKNEIVSNVQKEITVIKNVTNIDAGGPYKTVINKELVVKGKILDSEENKKRIVRYSWDFNGDNKPEWSSDSLLSVKHVFRKSGKYVIWFTAEMKTGETVRDSSTVTVTNSKPVVSAGDDVLSRSGRNVKLNGTAQDKDSNIVRYEWDFDGDGKVDWSSAENEIVKHKFEVYSSAVFSVIDSDSARASDTIRIIICPEGMETIESDKFCIDKYEWPNKKGNYPTVDITYSEAQKKCSDLGKRLCTSHEWETACLSGKKRNEYPYGSKYEPENCNTMGNPLVKNKLSVSGNFTSCAGEFNIYDMSGNVAEWVESPKKSNPYVYGGSWQNSEEGSKCNSRIELNDGMKYFYAGFRCCK